MTVLLSTVSLCSGPDLCLDQHVESLKNIFCPSPPDPLQRANISDLFNPIPWQIWEGFANQSSCC